MRLTCLLVGLRLSLGVPRVSWLIRRIRCVWSKINSALVWRLSVLAWWLEGRLARLGELAEV